MTDASGVGLYRWTFNTGLTSSDITSEEIVLPAGHLTSPRSLEIVDQGPAKVVFVGNFANPGTLARVSFDSFAGDTTSTASIAVTGSDGVADVAITYDCPDWHGIVSSFNNDKVFHLAFGSDLTQSPTVNELTTASVALPAGVELEMEAGERYGFVQEFGSGDLVRLTFDSDWTLSTSGVLVNSGTTSTWGIKLVKDSSAWRGFTIGLNDRVERYTFPESCATTTPISTDETPLGIFYTSDGVYDIQLTATDSDGNYIQSTQSVTVLSNTAPDASFAVTDERCIDASSTFSANTLGMSYSWDFNGEGVGSTQEEAFQFPTSGEKTVTLTVDDGTCTNSSSLDITIYEDVTLSSPSFTVIGDLCSNNGLTFQNNTVETGIEDVVGYLWDIDGTASTETNPTFTFATSGSKSVGLQAYIPGCTTSIDYQVLSVATGPSVSFDFSNNCSVGSTVEFTSSVTGDGIDSYLWDFGDGSGSSMLENPTYSYGSAGTYTVSLTVSNDDGCSATISQDIEVTDDARVEIVLSAATENIETTFLANDLIVEDPAVSWSWTFAALG